MSKATRLQAFFIGFNGTGQLGLGHRRKIHKLAECKYPITEIHPGCGYIFYNDKNYENIWCAGRNIEGQCGIGQSFKEFLTTCTKYTFFKQNGIQIKKICVAVGGAATTFFITTDNKLYGCGYNRQNQLGLDKFDGITNKNKPVLIPQLTDVIDITSSSKCSVALCSSHNVKILKTIINHWCRLYFHSQCSVHTVPEDVISLLVIFSKFNSVYSTAYDGHGHGDKYPKEKYFGWKEIEKLSNKNIIKIAACFTYVWYLGANGVVYACGYKINQRGLTDDADIGQESMNIPTEIRYFKENGIKIIDIAAGYKHSLALDEEGKLFGYGANKYGQCGDGTYDDVKEPKLIETLNDYKIDVIKCGYNTSYCRTVCGKHFIWGQNDDNECLTYDKDEWYEDLLRPHRIDNTIYEECDCSKVVNVYPGYYTLQIITESRV